MPLPCVCQNTPPRPWPCCRASNEAAFLYQLFVRSFGTNNLPDCSNLCHESSGKALTETIGIGKGTVQLDDFEAADLILILGQNPGTNHPRMLTTLADAAERGAAIVTINPLRERALESFAHPQTLLGLIGEYIGRTFLTVNQRPQSVVREVISNIVDD